MRKSLLSVAFVLWAVSAFAQEVVSVRFYLVPKVGDGTKGNSFRPKYTDPNSLGEGWHVAWQGMDYGQEDTFLLACDVTPQQHTTLAAQSDVLSVPVPLDDTVSPVALTVVQNQLEAMRIPGSWVTTDHTYRQVLRTTARIILFMQRYQGMFPEERAFPTGVTLATRFNQLTAGQRQRLIDVSDSLGIDRTGLTGAMTLRELLRALADQLPAVTIRGEDF